MCKHNRSYNTFSNIEISTRSAFNTKRFLRTSKADLDVPTFGNLHLKKLQLDIDIS